MEIHPSVIRLGLQISQGLVTGSTSRCVQMLLAFKVRDSPSTCTRYFPVNWALGTSRT